MEQHEYNIMKALLKRLYQEKVIAADSYGQAVERLDGEWDNICAARNNDSRMQG